MRTWFISSIQNGAAATAWSTFIPPQICNEEAIKLVIYLAFCLYASPQWLSIQLPESPIPAKIWFQGRILLQWTYSTSTTNNTIEFIIQGVDCGRECNCSRLQYQGILKRFYSQAVCQGCCCWWTQKLHNSTCSGQPELAFIRSGSATRSSVLKQCITFNVKLWSEVILDESLLASWKIMIFSFTFVLKKKSFPTILEFIVDIWKLKP